MKTMMVYLNNDKLVSRGVGYVIMAARAAGHHVDFYDTVWTTREEMIRAVVREKYDVIMVSSTSFYRSRAINLAYKLKIKCEASREHRKKVHVVFGGMLATIEQAGLFASSPWIDYLCVGEGEGLIADLLGRLGSGQSPLDLPNLGYRREDGVVVINPPRPCTDLHSLPPFDYDVFNPKSVVRDGEMIPGFTYITATRGCPYRCSYCSNSYLLDLYPKKFLRTQKVDTVLAELQQLRDNYPMTMAYFGDEMIAFDYDYCRELFTRIKSELGLPYGCMFRTEAVDERLVTLLRETGCRYVAMGVECGDEDFRRRWLNRRGTNQSIIDAFRQVRACIPGVFLTSFNMKGFPVSFDARLTQATKQLNRTIGPNHVQMTWFYPIPGTKLYDYCKERDLIDPQKQRAAEDYFRGSILRPRPIPSRIDVPIYDGGTT